MAKKAAAKPKKTTSKKGAKPARAVAKPAKAKPSKQARAKATAAKAKAPKAKPGKPIVKKTAAPKKKVVLKKPVPVKAKKVVVKKQPTKTAVASPAKPKVAAVPAAKSLPAAPKVTAAPPAKPVAAKPAPAPPAPARPVAIKKRPVKEKFQIEFQVRSTPSALYDMLLSPSGFSEWYCDDVDVRGEEYTFKWGSEEERAMIIGQRQNEVTRFHRIGDEDDESYFEFRIKIDPITDEVALIVTDHCWPDEMENAKALWASQIANLARVLGA
ncbi:MAG: START-like domain-containing protein [Flavobacteriales bacterium]